MYPAGTLLQFSRVLFLSLSVGAGARATPSIPVEQVLQAMERVESGGDPLAIRDNSDNRSISPLSLKQAIAAATDLLSYNHDIDVGVMQVNRVHFDTTVRRMGLRWEQLFDPQIARQVARMIFDDIYTRVAARLGSDNDLALWRTVGCYNGGEKAYTYVDNVPYQSKVMAQLGLRPNAVARAAGLARLNLSSVNLFAAFTGLWHEQWKIGQPLEDGLAIRQSVPQRPGIAVEFASLALVTSLALTFATLVGTGLLLRFALVHVVLGTSKRATRGMRLPK